jgi:hypothetical protein
MKNNFGKCMIATVLAMAVLCLVPTRTVAQQSGQQDDAAAKQRAIEEEAAKLKAAGPQRDHDEDAANWTRIAAERKAKAAAALKAASDAPTPRNADGHPDLNGMWVSPGGGNFAVVSADGKDRKVLFSPLDENGTKARDPVPQAPPNQPSYKPEFVAKVQNNWFDTNHNDPTAFVCKNPGVPRLGPPDDIVQTPGQVVLLYKQGTAGGNPFSTFRIVHTDGRPHRTDVDPSAMGDAVGHWDGATLVIDVTNLTDDTWLSEYGTLHSEGTHVIERMTRKGNTLEYIATVDDPTVLTKPWTTTPVTRLLAGPDVEIDGDFPCVDNDSAHLTGLIHH